MSHIMARAAGGHKNSAFFEYIKSGLKMYQFMVVFVFRQIVSVFSFISETMLLLSSSFLSLLLLLFSLS